MKIYDISQEVFGCTVFPGDEAPYKYEDKRISRGDLFNQTSFKMITHNGTHVDAPFHFLADGDTIDQLPLEKLVGYCYVCAQTSDLGAEEAQQILNDAKRVEGDGGKRILIKGPGAITEAAANVFAQSDIYLLGVENQSAAPEDAPVEVHKTLLSAKIVLLEGIRLGAVEEGVYLLSAAPLSLGGSDGSPCRALLIQM